jgi:hypothetical protein
MRCCLAPAASQTSHLVDQLLGVERLVHEVVCTHARPAYAVVRLLLAGQQYYGHAGGFALDFLAEIVAAIIAEIGVDECDGRTVVAHLGERICRPFRDDGSILLARKGDFQHPSHGFAVINGQQRGGHRSSQVRRLENTIIRFCSESVKEFAGRFRRGIEAPSGAGRAAGFSPAQ